MLCPQHEFYREAYGGNCHQVLFQTQLCRGNGFYTILSRVHGMYLFCEVMRSLSSRTPGIEKVNCGHMKLDEESRVYVRPVHVSHESGLASSSSARKAGR